MSFFMRNYHAVQAFLNLQLPAKAKHVFLTLDLRANKEGVCWPSLSRIARDTCSSLAAVKRGLACLVKEDLVERISEAGRVTHYRIIDPQKFLLRAQITGSKQVSPPPPETGISPDQVLSDLAHNEPTPQLNPAHYEPGIPLDPAHNEPQNIKHLIGIEQQQKTSPPSPNGGPVVVVSVPTLQQDLNLPISATSESAASALNQVCTKDPICVIPSLSFPGAPAETSPAPTPNPKPLSIALTRGSLFAPYREQLEGLAARHGVEKVADYVDKLDWQYRQKKEPPGKPIALLNKLLREGMITPEGYQTPQEREVLRREKAGVSQAARAEEACKRQEAEARRGLRAYSDTLFEALPPERKEPYLRQAAQGMPSFLAQGPWLEAEAERIFFEEVGARLARAALRMSDQDPAGEGPTGPSLGEGHLRHENQTPWGAVPLRSPEKGEGHGRVRGTSPPAGLPG